ncbi:uncharacterized protein LOC131657974 [Vicia villosa]|uniref:uncharacterized protein LOC131657974 n=1 Tax=Vicia villosa TaxID=3911 RepID=UPI00273BB070|nr:uncharacterized protein LOC131657974 [Vicia villosa]
MTNQKNQEAAIKNLETQVRQLAKQIAANQSNATFSAKTRENPKEHCKAVFTRTGQKGGEEEIEINDTEKEDNDHATEEKENEVIMSDMTKTNERETNETKKKRKSVKKKVSDNVIPSQHLPYPHAPSKKADSMLIKKKGHKDEETVVLDAQCSAVIQRTTPRKESDPGRVTLPLNIEGNFTGDGLIDLGSSINLIPLSIVKKLGNIVMTPTRMTLQLADKSITSPYGVVQDLLVKVDKFFFSVDFVVVDMEEDHEVPVILGKPFMKTARMMIDMDAGIMKVRVQDEEVKFNLFEAKNYFKNKTDIFRIDTTQGELKDAKDQV